MIYQALSRLELSSTQILTGIAGLLLIGAVISDLRWRKIPNSMLLIFLPIGLLLPLIFNGLSGLFTAILGLTIALGLSVPLYLIRGLGGGDVKLFAVLALFSQPLGVISILIYSVFWGVALGLFKAILDGQLRSVLKNTSVMVAQRTTQVGSLHHIPYSIPLFFGWLSVLALGSLL